MMVCTQTKNSPKSILSQNVLLKSSVNTYLHLVGLVFVFTLSSLAMKNTEAPISLSTAPILQLRGQTCKKYNSYYVTCAAEMIVYVRRGQRVRLKRGVWFFFFLYYLLLRVQSLEHRVLLLFQHTYLIDTGCSHHINSTDIGVGRQ